LARARKEFRDEQAGTANKGEAMEKKDERIAAKPEF